MKTGMVLANQAERTTLKYGKDEIPLSPPELFVNPRHGSIAIDFISEIWDRYPKGKAVAKLINNNAWFSHYGLTTAVMAQERRSNLQISMPDELQACGVHFEDLGYTSRASQNGRYANSFVQLVGGISQLRNLANEPVLRLLDYLAIKSTKKVAQRVVAELKIPDAEAKLVQILNGVEVISEWKTKANTINAIKHATGLEKKALMQLLTSLAELKILQRGLFVSCEQCGVPTWHSIATVTERIQCPGCGHSGILPIEYPAGSGLEMQWQYTLNSLTNRVMDQDVLPHLLAINFLSKDGEMFAIQPGVELLKKGSENVDVEFDFLFVRKQQLIGGECKSGTKLSAKDFATARRAHELGFEAFWFCTTDEFEPETVNEINSLASELKNAPRRMMVRALDRTQLLGAKPAYKLASREL